MTAEEIEQAWPQIERQRAELAGEPMSAPEADLEPSVDVVAKQVGILLHDWEILREAVRRAEELNGELSRELDTVTTERDMWQDRCQRALAALNGSETS